MSSYLTFYVVPKREKQEEPKKYLPLTAYPRSSDIYHYFTENLPVVFEGLDAENAIYTTLKHSSVAKVLEDIRKGIQCVKDKIVEYEKYAADNSDYINDIVEMKEYLTELQFCEGKVSFIEDLAEEVQSPYAAFEEVCCNID